MLLLGKGSEATESYTKYDIIRPHSIRSLQFDQKVRLLSLRPEKFRLFTATPALPTLPNSDAHFAEKSSAKCPMLSTKSDSAKWDSAKGAYTIKTSCKYDNSKFSTSGIFQPETHHLGSEKQFQWFEARTFFQNKLSEILSNEQPTFCALEVPTVSFSSCNEDFKEKTEKMQKRTILFINLGGLKQLF